jgi:hypothetical protein
MSLPTRPFFDLANELNDIGPAVENHFVLFGSSTLYLHGLRDEIGDVDMFVTPFLFDTLLLRGWELQTPAVGDPPLLEYDPPWQPPAHAFSGWKKRGYPIYPQELIRDPEFVSGWPCQNLQLLCIWKATIAHEADRARDWDDVAAIANYLSGN